MEQINRRLTRCGGLKFGGLTFPMHLRIFLLTAVRKAVKP